MSITIFSTISLYRVFNNNNLTEHLFCALGMYGLQETQG